MKDISTIQRKILDYIRHQISNKGYAPSIREICQGVGLKSTSSVYGHIQKLEQAGYIRKDPSKPRALVLTEEVAPPLSDDQVLNIPVIGEIAAGVPILADENIEEYLPLHHSFIGQGTHFLLRVKGESMINAGIYNRDYILIQQKDAANNGDIVAALLDDSATVKTYYKEQDGRIRLQPENDTMSPIYTDFVKILGKVKAVIRKLE